MARQGAFVTGVHPYFDNGGRVAALAHRGFSLDGLENSMAAFAAAAQLGFQYIETDAHGTRDGVAVALHDSTLERTTDGRGKVSDLPVKAVTAARIGGVEPVPLLEDLLGTFPQLKVNIDVKSRSGIEPIAQAIERTNAHDRVCVASFSTVRRRATTKLLSKPVATSAGVSEMVRFVALKGAGGLSRNALNSVGAIQVPWKVGKRDLVTPDLIARAHAAGALVHVWTINDAPSMEALLDIGVDGLISDRADILRDVLLARGQWSG